MATYRRAEQLEGKALESGDILYFCNGVASVRFDVQSYYFRNHKRHNGLNCKLPIFWAMGIEGGEDDKHSRLAAAYCAKHYGYDCKDGGWPAYRCDDYAAATRVAIALFKDLAAIRKKNWRAHECI